MVIKYRIQFTSLFGNGYEHWDYVSLIENSGWVTCCHLNEDGTRKETPVTYYPREIILNVLKYGIE